METLATHISDWLLKKRSCTIFQDTVSRLWPVAKTKAEEKRDEQIQAWAKSLGWEATIKDLGIRVTLKKLADQTPASQMPTTKIVIPAPTRSQDAPEAKQDVPLLVPLAPDLRAVKGEDASNLVQQLRDAKKRKAARKAA